MVAFAGAALFLLGPGHEEVPEELGVPASPPRPVPARESAVSGDQLVEPRPEPPAEPRVIEDMVALADQLGREDASVEDDVAIVHELIRVYTRYVGTVPEGGLNDEIVQGLLGENPMKMIFLDRENARINEKGELVDRFGTPYDFHPVSSQELEIRSAGPDRVHFTADDVVPE